MLAAMIDGEANMGLHLDMTIETTNTLNSMVNISHHKDE